jgi:hypothetical protein
MSAEGAAQSHESGTPSAGPSGLKTEVRFLHALTDVAIKCRPFGPETSERQTEVYRQN